MSSPEQAQGFLGRLVDGMIRRSVRKAFYGVYWIPPAEPVVQPCIITPNHHGWHDGYVMYLALTKLGWPFLDWITEFESFPLFGKVGGMPFPRDDAAARAATIRQTVRRLKSGERNLLLFAESELHRPPELLAFGDALTFVAKKGGAQSVVPVAIRYEMSLHERPECFVVFGKAMPPSETIQRDARLAVAKLLDHSATLIRHDRSTFQLLSAGTGDVNERLDVRKFQPWKR
jgi:1-acyl-sn-glycerol-3-phosphate acyltransferase